MLCRILAGVFVWSALVAAADIHGTITIERKLTRHNVTAPAGLYQRGLAVELGNDADTDPLAFERTHVAIYIEGSVARPGAQQEERPKTIEQRERRFVPDFVVIPAGSSVVFPNFDPIFHNVFSLSKAKNFDLGNFPKGDSRTVTFASPGLVAVYCHLHPNMAASIVITPNRYATQADRDGNFTLKDVPAGNYTIVAWHKTAGTFRKTVNVSATAGGDVNFILPYVDGASAHPLADNHLANK